MSNTTKTETKTDSTTQAPKTEKSPFEMPNPFATFASFDPMTFWSQSQQAWSKAFSDAQGRAQSFADQYATMEKEFVTRAQTAVTHWAQLAHDAISYGAQLSSEARKMSFDTARKMSAAN